MTRKELSQLHSLSGEIKFLRDQLEQVTADAERTTAILSDMPRASGTNDKVGKTAAIIADIKDTIRANIEKYWNQYNSILDYINGIDDAVVRQALTLKYLDGLKWCEVTKRIGGKNTEWSIKKMVYRYLKNN